MVLVAASRDLSIGHVLGVRGAGLLVEKLLDGPLDVAIGLDEGFASFDLVLAGQVLKLLDLVVKVFVAACFIAHIKLTNLNSGALLRFRGHGLHSLDALLKFDLDFAELHLLVLDDFLDLGARLLQGLGLAVAVLERLADVFLDKVASAHLDEDVVVVVHPSGHVQRGCERHHDLLAGAVGLHVREGRLGLVEFAHGAYELLEVGGELSHLLLDGLAQLLQLRGGHFGDVDLLISFG